MRYLITGNGSLTNAFISNILKDNSIEEIRVFSRNENNQVKSKLKFNDNRIKYIIGDIRDYNAIKEALNDIDICVCAAALKHIGNCQNYPDECKKTNIDGNINVINASIENKVKKVIFISTDKATNPSTIYGCSKLFVEMYCKYVDSKNTDIITVRYGNVLGSNGSVVPIFFDKKEKGLPLSITNPNITRFFMSIEEAVNLILYAIKYGNNKDLIVYNNKACTVKELADCISDNQIITGLTYEEKSQEALITLTELKHSKFINNYYIINDNIISDIEYNDHITSDNCERLTTEELVNMLEIWYNKYKG
jgi:UDP-glucose 4-epimerase